MAKGQEKWFQLEYWDLGGMFRSEKMIFCSSREAYEWMYESCFLPNTAWFLYYA